MLPAMTFPAQPSYPPSVRIDSGAGKSVGLAYVFWLLLGVLGGHKFYLGRPGMGLLYLFTFGLVTIGWLIDLFTLPGQVRRANTVGYLR